MTIPAQALDAQAEAAHPEKTVWVSANAGSGKTHVLSERVIRLLLHGCPPARILCLTYTKAAAAVMQKRIFSTLAQWTSWDDKKLQNELVRLQGKITKPQTLTHARQLFAKALETPGGLKIQTIHAFCESLLHQFSLEAQVPSHFKLMDELARVDILKKAKALLLQKTYSQNIPHLYEAFMLILEKIGETGLERLLNEAISVRQSLRPYLDQIFGCALQTSRAQAAHSLRKKFLLPPKVQVEEIVDHIKILGHLPPNLAALTEQYKHQNFHNFVARLRKLTQLTQTDAILDCIREAYFTGTRGEIRPRSLDYLLPKALCRAHPELVTQLSHKQDELYKAFDLFNQFELYALNLAGFQLCHQFLRAYENLKTASSLLDFDDLITHVLSLLEQKEANFWVHYKLDQGIDHILLDEAQDTSPAQWKIIMRLAEEFFNGMCAREIKRTLFAVGDEKQSIYSFQGAVPEDFARYGKDVQTRAHNARLDFKKVQLNYSFRSAQDVLKSVDTIFKNPKNYQGLAADPEPTVHQAVRTNIRGEVILWESLATTPPPIPENWHTPHDNSQAPSLLLAQTIAQTIDNWLMKGEILHSKGRPIEPSDIMILVRKRDAFIPALIRALKARGLPVAGADRLRLTDHIAVRDLMALGRFVLQPQDDLSLASLLKSPLFNYDEAGLYRLAYGRKGSLWESLNQDPRDKDACNLLQKYRAIVDQIPVFEFYSHLLSADGGRRKFLERLGAQAGDILDAFLDYTLSIQQNGILGLQAFLEILVQDNPEIKREFDHNRQDIRIMTVHAAKGLESGVVFLVDPGSSIWNAQHQPKLLRGKDGNFLWVPNKAWTTDQTAILIEGLKKQADDEYRRLLYVAMTRAEERLILCGYRGKNEEKRSWINLALEALAPHCENITPPAPITKAWRYSSQSADFDISPKTTNSSLPPPVTIPSFLLEKADPEVLLPRPLTPTRAGLEIDETLTIPSIGSQSPVLTKTHEIRSFYTERGVLIHQLLHYLPNHAEQKRDAIARTYIEHAVPHWESTQKKEVLRTTSRLLNDPRLHHLFSQKAQAEVSLMGIINFQNKPRTVSGQIDRLFIGKTHVIIADFKTGRPPENVGAIPRPYWLQMALYYALLHNLHPDKTIEVWLIYSAGPQVFCLNQEEMLRLLTCD